MSTRQPQRRRAPRPGASLALFPFLAVLVCVMGALVPLLLGISRMARRQALAEAQQRAAQSQEELRSELELVAWRIEQLKLSRQKTEEDLRQARDQLAHYEDHARRLQSEAQRLQNVLRSIGQSETTDRAGSRLQAQWEQVQAELASAERSLEAAQTAARQRKPSYAIIPYEGPSGTRRRPIYIECTTDAVVIQPEGIRLTADDFRGPLRKDNPLAATLRAIEAYWDRSGLIDAQGGQRPYPLLLVRASGVAAYAAAREAIAAWGSDFGYELIDDDWQLSYPPPDPQLLQVAQAALEQARQIQARIIAAAPRLYGADRPVYAVSPGRGGVVQIDGPATTSRYVGQPAAGPIGARLAAPEGHSGAAEVRTTGRLPSGGTVGQQSVGQSPPAGGQDNAASATATAEFSSPDGTIRHYADLPAGGSHIRSAVSAGQMQSEPQSGHHPTRQPLPEGVIVPPPPDGPTAHTTGPDDAPLEYAGRNPLRPGQWHPRPQTEANDRSVTHDQQQSPGKPNASLDRRVTNWGLPEVASGAIPLTRPIKIDCHPDRMVFLPETGVAPGKTIVFGQRTVDAVDEMILTVWERIRSWGMAGKGMYWRPVLQVSVAPDAEQRFEELSALLEGSGLLIQRR